MTQSANSDRLCFLRRLFERALELEPTERARFAASASEDPSLCAELERLLALHMSASFLEPPSVDELRRVAAEGNAIPPGTRFGPYEVVATIGTGGMGSIYLARRWDGQHDRDVAIKILHAGLDSDSVIARFRLEQQVLARLDHPGIARLYDGGISPDGVPYLVLEYIRGVAIDRWCQEHGADLDQRLALFEQVTEAVHAAHQNLVLHRDLKPGNVLVTDEGVVKLVDFGVAKFLLPDGTARVTATLDRRITLQYASPEQVRGQPTTTRTDVYGLGLVLYDLLTGSRPYVVDGPSPAQWERTICETDPPPPSVMAARSQNEHVVRFARRLRGDLDSIVMTALCKEPARRYSSAEALLADVRAHRRGFPVRARPDTWTYRTCRLARRHRTFAIAAGGALAASTVGAVSFVVASNEAKTNLASFQRLSDVERYDTLQHEAQVLWPLDESRIPAVQRWIAEAESLLRRLPEHRQSEARLRERVADPSRSASSEDRWQLDVTSKLIANVEGLLRDDEATLGTLSDMRSRIERSATLRRRSILDHQAKWDAATIAIANHPDYGGLRLPPQMGLVPLGPDPRSGLWEFWQVETGEPVTRSDNGELLTPDRAAIVLVLVPGGTYYVGSQNTDPSQPYYYELASQDEYPVQRIALDPYFLGKHEVTQAQWECIAHSNPSARQPEVEGLPESHSFRHPVEQVSSDKSQDVLRRIGLTLPTEAQWEVAARARTTSPWWTGATRESLMDPPAGNLADRDAARKGAQFSAISDWPEYADEWSWSAPVGWYRPNPWGFCDMIGNVGEWCLDRYASYSKCPVVRAGDGLRLTVDNGSRPHRGGNFQSPARFCRSALRDIATTDDRRLNIGVRAARPLDRH